MKIYFFSDIIRPIWLAAFIIDLPIFLMINMQFYEWYYAILIGLICAFMHSFFICAFVKLFTGLK